MTRIDKQFNNRNNRKTRITIIYCCGGCEENSGFYCNKLKKNINNIKERLKDCPLRGE